MSYIIDVEKYYYDLLNEIDPDGELGLENGFNHNELNRINHSIVNRIERDIRELDGMLWNYLRNTIIKSFK